MLTSHSGTANVRLYPELAGFVQEKNLAGSWEEVLYLGLHYAWFLGCVIGTLPLLKALAFMILAQVFAGMMLSIVFVQSHNGMEVYHDKKDFVTAQIVSTRDIAPSLWNDWFSGGSSLPSLLCPQT